MGFKMGEIWKDWDLLHARNPLFLEEKDDKYLFPYLMRLSGRAKHIEYIKEINKAIFKIKNHNVLMHELFYNIQPDPWCGSIKATKFDEKKLDTAKPYIKKIFGWSEREFNFQKQFVVQWIEDPSFIEELNKKVSLEKKEAKILGAEYVKYKPKPKAIPKKPESSSLFSF